MDAAALVLLPVAVALLAAVAWLWRGGRPPPPDAIGRPVEAVHDRQVAVLRSEAHAVVDDAAHVDEVPVDAERNREIGRRLRERRP